MRGKPQLRSADATDRRLIPAHAGKTPKAGHRAFPTGAHPRACGENNARRPQRGSSRGSSPRMRGKPRQRTWTARTLWLIPAHAGKTLISVALVASTPAHPRACGENPREWCASAALEGSSPRMRGKPTKAVVNGYSLRLIPAHAGKTNIVAATMRTPRAHPRACGENPHAATWWSISMGSSPRMRGKLQLADDSLRRVGLIPAHAGKTPLDGLIVDKATAHPRACGENQDSGDPG